MKLALFNIVIILSGLTIPMHQVLALDLREMEALFATRPMNRLSDFVSAFFPAGFDLDGFLGRGIPPNELRRRQNEERQEDILEIQRTNPGGRLAPRDGNRVYGMSDDPEELRYQSAGFAAFSALGIDATRFNMRTPPGAYFNSGGGFWVRRPHSPRGESARENCIGEESFSLACFNQEPELRSLMNMSCADLAARSRQTLSNLGLPVQHSPVPTPPPDASTSDVAR